MIETTTERFPSDGNLDLSDEDKTWNEIYERFNNQWNAEQLERSQSLQDRRFVTITGAQYEGPWGELFANTPMIEINKTAQGVNAIERQYKQSRYTVEFRAVDQPDDNDTAKTLNGLLRADLYLSKGMQARDNAFIEGSQGGYGAWRLTNVYVDEESEDDDQQKIIWEIITDADQSVFWDQNAKLYDKSDASDCFIISPMTIHAFKARFGEDKISSWPAKIIKPYYDWFTPEVVRVAEYYKIIEVSDTVYKLALGIDPSQTVKIYKSDKDFTATLKDYKTRGYAVTFKKDIKRKECRKWILSGAEILSEPEGKLIAGGMIPVVPYYGMRSYIDNLERCRGHVRLAKDPQRVYNAQVNKLVETTSIAPMEVPIVTAEQISGHENEWAEANVNRAAYRVLNTVIDESSGQKIITGPVGQITPPVTPPVVADLITLTNNDIQELTNSQDGAGQVKANVSSVAMDIAATRTDDKAGLYLDNMMQSIQREGEIYLAMAKDVYFQTDRQVTTLSFNSKQKPVFNNEKLNSRGVDVAGNQIIKNNIAEGQFHVISDVAEDSKTKRDKIIRNLTNLVQIIAPVDPDLAGVLASLILMNMDAEGLEDVQTWIHTQLVQKGVIQPTPEEAQQMQQQAQQQAQQPASPEEQLALSTAKNQEAQALKAQASAQESHTKALVNIQQAGKIHAETVGAHVENVQQLHAPIPVAPIQAVKPKPNFFSRLLGSK